MGTVYMVYLLSAASCVLNPGCLADGTTIVATRLGSYMGVTDSSYFNGVTRFLGIPFAKPPVGSRRFQRPEPMAVLSSTYNATFMRPLCPQLKNERSQFFQMDEDCLHLNIYVPGTTSSRNSTFPVMIWIYGGSFIMGAASYYTGDYISSVHNVIVITFNYRLNVFGFLSNGSASSGNFGLWDQKLAIKWVNENIGSFGGDVSRITLFGHSAGAASVLYQAMNVANKGLFQRAIAQSGSSVALWALNKDPRSTYISYVAKSECASTSDDLVIKCLRNKTVEELLSYTGDLESGFVPFTDYDFVTDDPVVLLSGKTAAGRDSLQTFADLDYMSGITDKDGEFFVTATLEQFGVSDSVTMPLYRDVFLPLILRYYFQCTVSKDLLSAVENQYKPKSDDLKSIYDIMVDISTDVLFLVHDASVRDVHANVSSSKGTYIYEFTYKPSFYPGPSWLDGAAHGAEVAYVFGLVDSLKALVGIDPNSNVTIPLTTVDFNLRNVTSTMWTNFAKTGNPNLPTPLGDLAPQWPRYDEKEGFYLRFATNSTVERHLASARVTFWRETIPKLQACVSTTTSPPTGGAGIARAKYFIIVPLILLLIILSVK